MLKQVTRATSFSRAIVALKSASHEPRRLDRCLPPTYASSQTFRHRLFHLSSGMMQSDVTEGSSVRCEDSQEPMSSKEQSISHMLASQKMAGDKSDLVTDLFKLSQHASVNRISLVDFFSSATFKRVEEQIELQLSGMGNSMITNLVASLIKMKADSSLKLMKLLECEIKFRLETFTLNQTLKILKFYATIELSAEQKEIFGLLLTRLRGRIDNREATPEQLISILHFTSTKQVSESLLDAVEKQLSDMLVTSAEQNNNPEYKKPQVNYNLLCSLFIALAKNKRRPTPILRAISIELCQIPIPKTSDQTSARTILIIDTLEALTKLSYQNTILISKLMGDLLEVIDLKDLDSYTKRNLLRLIGLLGWRSPDLLAMYFCHIIERKRDLKKLDYRLVASLLQVSAKLNYRFNDINQLYVECIKGNMEDAFDGSPWRWLDHVWSLVNLGVAEKSHLESVLNDRFYQSLKSDSRIKGLFNSNLKKLLNLYAIARYELNLTDLRCTELVDPLNHPNFSRPPSMQNRVSIITRAVNILVGSNTYQQDTKTPFGFVIDYELMFNKDLEFVSLEGSFQDAIKAVDNGESTNIISDSNLRKCALIYVPHEDSVTNVPHEPVCDKLIISRILSRFGYETLFLFEDLVSRQKTASDLSASIKGLIDKKLG